MSKDDAEAVALVVLFFLFLIAFSYFAGWKLTQILNDVRENRKEKADDYW